MPLKLNPTWRNRRCGEDHIAKRLDRFLVVEHLVSSLNHIWKWVAEVGDSNHNPILIELKRGSQKPPNPFKFNASWIADNEFQEIVSSHWTSLPYEPHGQVAILFLENLKKIKQDTLAWAHGKKIRDARELVHIEKWIFEKTRRDEDGFSYPKARDDLVHLEKRRRSLLEEKEVAWRLKSRAIWLNYGDENNKLL